jgi:serine/threonine protein kinase
VSEDSLWVTTATHAEGTAAYMAPELLRADQATVTKEGDIYAFAMTTYESDFNQSDGTILMLLHSG